MKMKKRMMKMAAMMMAMTMVMGSAMTVHASEDGCYQGDGNPSNDESFDVGFDGGSSDSGNSSSGGGSSESYSEPSQSYDGGGSSDYNDGCYHGDDGASYNGSEGESGGFDNGSSSNSSASYSAPARKAPGSNTGVTGKEQFRALAKSGEGSYKVTHKGQDIATFWLVDAEGKNVPCNAVALKQRSDDKKWAINFEVADSEGLNIGALSTGRTCSRRSA